MLNAMRGLAGSFFAKALIILLILSFGLWGIEDMLNNSSRNAAVAKIDGHSISRTEFEQAYRKEMERVRAQLGKNYSPELVRTLRVENRVLNDIITGQLVELETRALGLVPSDDEVAREIAKMDTFKNEQGKFDKNVFNAVLRQNGTSEQALAADIRRQISTRLLFSSIGAASPINDSTAAALFAAQNEERFADIAVLQSSLVKDLQNPTDEDIKGFYDANKDVFVQPEYRTLSLLTISKDALLKQVEVPEKDVKAAYDERAALFGKDAAPFDKVKASIERDLRAERADTATGSLATKIQDAIAGGDTPEEAAKAFGMNYSLLGTITSEGLLKDGSKAKLPNYERLLDTAFKLEENGDSPLSPAGDVFYMIHVNSVEASAPLPLEKVKSAVASAWKKEQTAKKLSAIAHEIAEAMKASKHPEKVLQERGISTQSSGAVKRNSQKTASNVALPGSLVADIFEKSIGQATSAHQNDDDNFIVAVVKSRKIPENESAKALAKNDDFKVMRERMMQNSQSEIVQNFLISLRNKYSVTINEEALKAYAERE